MLASRASLVGRIVFNGLKAKAAASSKQIVRQSHAWNYREGPIKHPAKVMIAAECVGGFMWWWVLWHLWHEYEHITGEFEYPDVTKWTNAELGVPPDDAELTAPPEPKKK